MNDSLRRLRDQLVNEARRKLQQPRQFIHFTNDRAVDELLNDLDRFPHAFVIACVMDRQIRAEKAWKIPYELKQRIGSLAMEHLSGLTINDIGWAMRHPSPLHRFANVMTENLFSAVHRIGNHYHGDARRIWDNRPPSATIVRRFLEFDGVGQKIATMAANILVRDFRIPVSDYYSIDISVDVQVRRVFSRMGFAPEGADMDYIVYRARELHPEYPGIFDTALWEVGRSVCRPKQPMCEQCSWAQLCAYSSGRHSA